MNIAEQVFAAVTSGGTLRAHLEKLPQKGNTNYILPMLVITTISGHSEMHLRGDDGLRRYLIQLDAWATTRKGADDCMEAARTKMLGATAFSVGSIQVSGAEGYDDVANLFRASLEFGVWVNP